MDFLKITDLTKSDIDGLIKRAIALKGGAESDVLSGKTVALIFEKPSTRTRVSFEVGIGQLGGRSIFLNQNDSQIGRGEPIKDTARVMSRYVDGVVIRTFGHSIITEFAEFSTVPVINGLTDLHHPCQIMADLLTIVEKKAHIKNSYENLKVAWVGDGNNMAHSWIEAAEILGFELNIACPDGYCPDKDIFDKAIAAGAKIKKCVPVKEAVADCDVINTDVWASMGQEEEQVKREKAFDGYIVDEELLALAKDDAIVMHCLPAHRGEEISEDVLEGSQSVVWDQAENRLHIQKAILEKVLS